MSNRIIEGPWEEVIQRQDLRGHRVRVVVVDEPVTEPVSGADWVARLHAWVDSQPAVTHFVDDSRESIYGGTVDDPR